MEAACLAVSRSTEGDLALDADLAPYARAKGTLKLPYARIDYALIERVVRGLLEMR